MARTRPDRTPAHLQRDALLAQFASMGLVATISTNGSVEGADLEQTFDKTVRPGGGLSACVLTEAGQARLEAAGARVREREG